MPWTGHYTVHKIEIVIFTSQDIKKLNKVMAASSWYNNESNIKKLSIAFVIALAQVLKYPLVHVTQSNNSQKAMQQNYFAHHFPS